MFAAPATREEGFIRVRPGAPLPEALRGAVVAIGNFDGVHRGHQAVLEAARDIGAAAGRPAAVLTFEPHPRTVFRPHAPVFRLTPAAQKARILKALGFDGVIETAFTHAFSELSADAFVTSMLVDRLAASHIVTGVDFHFGKGRGGGPAFLIDAGERLGFGVTLIDAFRDENADVVSSSRIRAALADGDVITAAALLGHRFAVQAAVIEGRKLGRTLGYPTANMRLDSAFALKPGIYAVRMRLPDGNLHDGVASFGCRPTVDEDGEALLETFIFDYQGDLYGKTGAVTFFAHLRDEARFDGLEALKAQMRRDEAEARAVLAGVVPLGRLDQDLNF